MLPVLYSFRRCPYAMRARLALKVSGVAVELREVVLAKKPPEMLLSSPKGTVPVLVLQDQSVIDESREIIEWALAQHDPQGWLDQNADLKEHYRTLVNDNDGWFKQSLDRYKYAVRFPEHPMEYYRELGEGFLQQLESRLQENSYLLCERPTIADMAIFPFIRQFAHVDRDWFYTSRYQRLQQWLDDLLNSSLFAAVMKKYQPWKAGDLVTVF